MDSFEGNFREEVSKLFMSWIIAKIMPVIGVITRELLEYLHVLDLKISKAVLWLISLITNLDRVTKFS